MGCPRPSSAERDASQLHTNIPQLRTQLAKFLRRELRAWPVRRIAPDSALAALYDHARAHRAFNVFHIRPTVLMLLATGVATCRSGPKPGYRYQRCPPQLRGLRCPAVRGRRPRIGRSRGTIRVPAGPLGGGAPICVQS